MMLPQLLESLLTDSEEGTDAEWLDKVTCMCLHCTSQCVLSCTTQACVVLCCAVGQTARCNVVLRCTALYYAACAVLCCAALCCLCCAAMRCAAMRCAALGCAVLRCAALAHAVLM